MQNRLPTSISLLALLLALPAQARTISWADAVALAKQNNPELSAAAASLRSAEAQEGVARAGFLPKVGGTIAATRANGVTGNTTTPASNIYSASLTGSQNLFSGLADAARVKQAKANAAASEASLQGTNARVSYELKNSFEGLLYAQEFSALTDQIIKRRQENLKLVQLRFDSGRENKGSVLLSQAYLSQAEFDNLQARNIRKATVSDFARTLALDEEDIEIAGQVPVTEPTTAQNFQSLAHDTPTFLQTAAQEEAASAGITVARAGFFPTLDLSASYGRNDTNFFPQTPDRWSTTLTLSVPFFSGGRDYYSTKSAAESWQAAALKTEDTGREQRAALTQAFTAYEESAAKLKVDQNFRDAATLRAQIARTKYNNGLLSFEDWDTIENDLITRQKTYLQTKRARVTAEAAWEQAQGIGVLQ